MSEARRAILQLLGKRGASATICPSEAARLIAQGDGWREEMARVHAEVDRLAAEGVVSLSWKGQPKAAREGPYRIAFASGR